MEKIDMQRVYDNNNYDNKMIYEKDTIRKELTTTTMMIIK